jgi:cytochrome P450
MASRKLDEPDFFTDRVALLDPYPFLDGIRARGGAVCPMRSVDALIVTGFAEARDVLLDADHFSSAISTGGPTAPLPFAPEGADITAQIAEHHPAFTGSELFITYDGARHSASRSLLNRLFVPSRLRANEKYMVALADRMIEAAVAKGGCEFINEIATSYVTLVIADLLGVPEDDRRIIEDAITNGPLPGSVDNADAGASLAWLAEATGRLFVGYIADRRANPRGDVLTDLATATYPDGSIPAVGELVNLAVFLFAAGQDTSAKLLGNAVLHLAEHPDLQQRLRDDRALIAPFIEEMLRMEGSSKVTFRLARKDTRIADVDVAAGTKVVLSLAGADRDPERWTDPHSFDLDRPRLKEHLAFGRGAHTCIGAPLARAEIRVMLDRLLDRTARFTLSEAHHGAPGSRTLDYEPSYIIRGLEHLHVDLVAR